MSKYVEAQAVTHAKRVRDHLRATKWNALTTVVFHDDTTVRGRRTYLGTRAFGLRLPDGSRRAIRYSDVHHLLARRED